MQPEKEDTRASTPYTPLPGRATRAQFLAVSVAMCRLYLGPDHLLLVDRHRLSEAYRRFYYHEIQSFSVIVEPWRGVRAAFFLLVFLVALMILLTTEGEARFFAAFGVIGLMIGSLWDWQQGIAVKVYVTTRTSFEWLPPLTRWKKASKVLEQLEEKIREAQRGMKPPPPVATSIPDEAPTVVSSIELEGDP